METFYSDAFYLIRTGRTIEYHCLLASNEHALFQMGTFLIWERLQSVCYRSALKLLWTIEAKSSRLTIDKVAVAFAQPQTNPDEVGCIVANLISVGLVKGYISQEKATLVLSQKEPFAPISSCKL